MTAPSGDGQLTQRWFDLNPAQADGLECVICETSYLDIAAVRAGATRPPSPPRVPVGFSVTGSQVVACVGICAALAHPPT